MMDDDEGWWTRAVSYETGAIYSLRCPSCGSFMARDNLKAFYNEWTEDTKATAHCKRCGDVEPEHLGWTQDYEDER